MEPLKPEDQNSKSKSSETPPPAKASEAKSSEKAYWLAFVMALVAIVGIAFGVQGNHDANEFAAKQKTMKDSVEAMQQTVDSLTAQLHEKERAAQPHQPATAEAAPEPVMPVRKPPVEHYRPRKTEPITAEAKVPAADPRFQELDDKLTIQEKNLADAQKALQDTRQNLEGKLSSTQDELSTSIARTHEDVVALQQRGERNYYEFKVDKSKNMTRVGPIQLALKKADLKRKRFDMEMMVDDNKLQKKSVNLFEPVYVLTSDATQPLQLVVNKVGKDTVEGYISVPKYTQSRLRLTEMEEKPTPPQPPEER